MYRTRTPSCAKRQIQLELIQKLKEVEIGIDCRKRKKMKKLLIIGLISVTQATLYSSELTNFIVESYGIKSLKGVCDRVEVEEGSTDILCTVMNPEIGGPTFINAKFSMSQALTSKTQIGDIFTGEREYDIYDSYTEKLKSYKVENPFRVVGFNNKKDQKPYQLPIPTYPLDYTEQKAYDKYNNEANRANFLGVAAFALTCVAAWYDSPTGVGLGVTGLVASYFNKSCIATQNKKIDESVLKDIQSINRDIMQITGNKLDPSIQELLTKRSSADKLLGVRRDLHGQVIKKRDLHGQVIKKDDHCK